MSVIPIIQKIKKRYYETYTNSVMLINPLLKWNIIKSSNSYKEVQAYMKKIVTEDGKYNGKSLSIIIITTNEKSESINLGVEIFFFKDQKTDIGKSYGKSIIIGKDTLLSMTDITHKDVEKVVSQMIKKGKKEFDGIKPYPYEKLFL